MISTRLRSTGVSCTAGAVAMERQSTTAPDYRSVHGTGLPFSGITAGATGSSAVAPRNAVVLMDALTDAQGSPPRGGPV